MKYSLLFGVGVAAVVLSLGLVSGHSAEVSIVAPESPVLVELFTSEGCSTCPPADALLQELDRSSSGSVVVLSEHVDYWNQLGWKDPYSSSLFSKRQNAYARQFSLQGAYTPQMVVDGSKEFVGNDEHQARKAIETARTREKVNLRIVSLHVENHEFRGRVEADSHSVKGKRAELFLAVVLDHAESQVARGENAGRKLTHAAVVRTLTKIGPVQNGPFSQEFHLPFDGGDDPAHLRVVAFVQEAGPGRVLGAAMGHASN